MSYSSASDVERVAGGAQRLVQLADYDRDGIADAAVIAAAIERADAWINTYAEQSYSVPFATVPTHVRELSAQEAVYQLKRDRSMVTEDDRSEHEERERWLMRLAKGEVSPGTDPRPPKSSHVRGSAFDRPSDKAVSRDKLRGYW